MGNCLDRALSDEEDMIGTSSSSSISPGDDTQSLINSTNQLSSNSHSTHQQRRHRSHRHHNHHTSSSRSHGGMSSLAMPINQRVHANSTFMQSFSLPAQQNRLIIPTNNTALSSSLQQYANSSQQQQQQQQFYYLTPNVQRTADQLTEEDQIKLLKRMALIQQLPSGSFDDSKKNKE